MDSFALTFASNWASPDISDEIIKGRINIFSIRMSMSPGNEINKIESLLKFMYLIKQPATMPAMTAAIVSMSRRLSTSHLHPCRRKGRKEGELENEFEKGSNELEGDVRQLGEF